MRSGSMPITAPHPVDRITAGISIRASFGVETITARAPLFSRMWVWSRSVLVV